MITIMPMCFKCKHFQDTPSEHWFRCTAFPEGIPNEIIYGRADHNNKYPGDKGIRFEQATSGNAAKLNDRMEKTAVFNFDEYIEKAWWDWSGWRKPKYDPSNKKSVSACRKFARMGVYKPGCARAIFLADNLYNEGKDDNQYLPPQEVDPHKMFSRVREEREAEREKKLAIDKLDQAFDNAFFYRDSQGRIIIMNWASLTTDEKKLLQSLFDERGVLKETKHREFDKRFKDYNARRMKRGLEAKKVT